MLILQAMPLQVNHKSCIYGPQVAMLTMYNFVSCKHTVTGIPWWGWRTHVFQPLKSTKHATRI